MAFDLNPVAVTAAPLLRAIKAGGWTSKKDLAERAGRHPKHIQRDLNVLTEQGLITDDGETYPLTPEGEAQLAALDRAADPTASSAGAGGLTALHADLTPHPLNPRKDFDSEEAQDALNELRENALARTEAGDHRGLLLPILVRPGPEDGKWWIVDGERRWRAIGQAIWDGDWPEDRPLPITVRAVDDREHLMLSLTANLQRADMSEIEEGVALNAAVHDFGVSTETLANDLGKSRRWVQLRIQLTDLSAEDQDRMRHPRGHPDRLGFKAALAQLQTARETPPPSNPWDHGGWVDQVQGILAEDYGYEKQAPAYILNETHDAGAGPGEGAEKIASRLGLKPKAQESGEPGSPAVPASPTPEVPTFGKGLTDREALIFVEVADKAERDPAADPALASESYTSCQSVPVEGVLSNLVAKGAIGFRQRGGETFVRPRLYSGGAKAWLEEIGFYAHRADVLFEMRTRVAGSDEAAALAGVGNYSSHFLNPADITPVASPTLKQVLVNLETEEPEQRALIEETEEEVAARKAAEAAARARALDEEAVDRFAVMLKERLSEARGRGRSGWNLPADRGGCEPALLADLLVAQVPRGHVLDVATYALFLTLRSGVMGGQQQLQAAFARACEPKGAA